MQVAKFLMSNAAAGSIIGKGGANITDLQNRYSAALTMLFVENHSVFAPARGIACMLSVRH